jgi:hypothetical protein
MILLLALLLLLSGKTFLPFILSFRMQPCSSPPETRIDMYIKDYFAELKIKGAKPKIYADFKSFSSRYILRICVSLWWHIFCSAISSKHYRPLFQIEEPQFCQVVY